MRRVPTAELLQMGGKLRLRNITTGLALAAIMSSATYLPACSPTPRSALPFLSSPASVPGGWAPGSGTCSRTGPDARLSPGTPCGPQRYKGA